MVDASHGSGDARVVHALSNHLAVILGFADLLIAETASDDPRRADLIEVRNAALAAAALLAPLREDLRSRDSHREEVR